MTSIVKKIVSGRAYYYAIKNRRVGKTVRREFEIYLGTAEDIIDAFKGRREPILKSYEFGSTAALLSIADELGFREAVQKATGDTQVWKDCLLMIAGRFSKALSKNGTAEWYKRTFLKMIWGEKYYSEKLYRTMDLLTDEAVDIIGLELAKNMADKGSLPELLYLDPTNFFTYIEEGEELPRKGKSKERRSDKNLVNLALAVTQDNLPIYHEIYEGNKHDARIFPTLVDRIAKRLESLGVETEDLVLVFDKGNNSEDNITEVLSKMHIIGSLKRDQIKDLLKVPLEEYKDLYTKGDGKKEVTIKGIKRRMEVFGREFTIVVFYNERSYRKQKKSYKDTKRRVLDRVKDIERRLGRKGRGRKLTPNGALKEILNVIPKQCSSIFKAEIQEDKFVFWIDTKKEQELKDSFGKTALFTDLNDWSSERIVKAYNGKYVLEDDVKVMKGALIVPLKPIFHRLDKRIKAHVFLCFLGVLFFRYLMLKVKSLGMSEKKVLQELEDIRIALLKDKKTKKAKVVVERLTLEQANLFAILGLNRFVP